MRRRKFKVFTALLLSAAMAVGSMACSAETEKKASGGATDDTTDMVSGQASSVTIATNKDLKDYRPWGGSNDMLINYQVYDSLVGIDTDGNYVPELAESWEMADDGMSFTFHLREDVSFQNGHTMTAEDVVWSVNAALDSGKVTTYSYGMDHMEVVDENTVKLLMAEPYPEVIGQLALTFFGIVDKSVAQKLNPDQWSLEEISGAGCGAYILSEVESGSHITLKAFEDYWGGAPEIKTVVFQIITDESTAVVAIKTGDVDFCYNLNQFDYDKMAELDTVETGEQECRQLVYMPVNVSEGNGSSPIQDEKVRQAVNYALDREALNTVFNDGYGTVTSNCNLPEEIGYNEDTQVRQDLEKAKQLMAESGYPDGCSLTMLICTAFNSRFKSVTEVAQAQLQEIGIQLEVIDQPMASFFDTLRTMDYGDFTLLTMEGQWPDPFYFYGALVRSQEYSSLNYSGNVNPEIDDLISELRTLTDKSEMQQGAEKLMELFYQDCSLLPLMFASPRKIAWNSNLQGVELNTQGYYNIANWSFK